MNWYHKFQKYAAFRNKVLMLAKKIATSLSNDIIGKSERKELKPCQITIDQNEEAELKDFGIRKIVIEIGELINEDSTVSIKGEFIKGWRDIKVNIDINFFRFGEKQYEFLATELRNILGHEIEHAENIKRNPAIPDSWEEEGTETLMDCIRKTEKYLLNESEINAYVKEYMRRSKYKGLKVEDLIKDFIKSVIFRCNPFEIEDHINIRSKTGIAIENIIESVNVVYQNRIDGIYHNRRGNYK